jgi:hypothetical protein
VKIGTSSARICRCAHPRAGFSGATRINFCLSRDLATHGLLGGQNEYPIKVYRVCDNAWFDSLKMEFKVKQGRMEWAYDKRAPAATAHVRLGTVEWLSNVESIPNLTRIHHKLLCFALYVYMCSMCREDAKPMGVKQTTSINGLRKIPWKKSLEPKRSLDSRVWTSMSRVHTH